MKEEPLVSIIVPVLDVEEYIERSVRSALRQTYRNIEVVVVDGGSEDGTMDALRRLYEEDSRLLVVSEKGGGVSEARNIGIRESSGEWLAFLDSDDEYTEDAIETMLETAEAEDADLVVAGYYLHTASTETEPRLIHIEPAVLRDRKEMQSYFLTVGRPFTFVWQKLYRRHIFDGVTFPEGKIFEDIYVTPYILDRSDSVVMIDRPLYHYYLRKSSITYSAEILQYFDGLDARLAQRDYIEAHYPELLPDAKDSVIDFGCYLLGKIEKAGRKQYTDEWEKTIRTIRENGKGARKSGIRMKTAVFLAGFSPALLGAICKNLIKEAK